MYRMIVTDLDETLISTDRTISKRNVEAIRKAVDKGVLFVPATGRGYNSVHDTLKTLGLYDCAGQYVISYNGEQHGLMETNRGGKLSIGVSLDEGTPVKVQITRR